MGTPTAGCTRWAISDVQPWKLEPTCVTRPRKKNLAMFVNLLKSNHTQLWTTLCEYCIKKYIKTQEKKIAKYHIVTYKICITNVIYRVHYSKLGCIHPYGFLRNKYPIRQNSYLPWKKSRILNSLRMNYSVYWGMY